ncbi:hypothetical protein AAC387_Pa02g0020 [Persea americana]
MDEMLDVFKQVKINLPLLDAIKQVPSCAKFLKDLCTQKRKSKSHLPKKILLTEQVSSIIHNDTPPKLKDPSTPTITCTIGSHIIDHALLDLGASVNILPYLAYEQIGLGELKPTPVALQLTDQSIKVPRGIIEDVLVKVDKFFFPVNFIVLDTEPVQNSQKHTPVILGRPFFATANANINCRTRIIDVSFGNMKVRLLLGPLINLQTRMNALQSMLRMSLWKTLFTLKILYQLSLLMICPMVRKIKFWMC